MRLCYESEERVSLTKRALRKGEDSQFRLASVLALLVGLLHFHLLGGS